MITFLWMLYLAFTLFLSSASIGSLISHAKSQIKEKDVTTHFKGVFITCLLWSIWYFYYLN